MKKFEKTLIISGSSVFSIGSIFLIFKMMSNNKRNQNINNEVRRFSDDKNNPQHPSMNNWSSDKSDEESYRVPVESLSDYGDFTRNNESVTEDTQPISINSPNTIDSNETDNTPSDLREMFPMSEGGKNKKRKRSKKNNKKRKVNKKNKKKTIRKRK